MRAGIQISQIHGPLCGLDASVQATNMSNVVAATPLVTVPVQTPATERKISKEQEVKLCTAASKCGRDTIPLMKRLLAQASADDTDLVVWERFKVALEAWDDELEELEED